MERPGWGRVGEWLDRLLGVHCLLCRAPLTAAAGGATPICEGCLEGLPWNLNPCARCAAPLPEESDGLCGGCLKRAPPWSAAFAPLRYDEPLDRLIKRFKFNAGLSDGRLLTRLFIDALVERDEPPPALILPVPLHRSRLRERGFNQSRELARPIAEALGVALADELCRRIRPTAVQSHLPAKERRANVRGAFALGGELPAKHIAVVDDVLTTGHTAAEITRLLRDAGAERVEIWTLARAGRPSGG